MSYQSTAVLKDRVAVVTGGAGGIGLETTKAMLAQGATVVISDIDTAKGEPAAKELGIEFFRADLTRSAEVSELAKYVLKQHGRIDVAFNNAGIAHSVPGEECTDEQWLRVININLNAVFFCCREFGQAMMAQGRGSIINTPAMSAIIANNAQPQGAYNAAKAGVIMLTKSMSAEWAKRGGRVNSISPAKINTPLTPTNLIGEPQDIAPAVVLLASDASSFFSGSNLVVDGGYTCW